MQIILEGNESATLTRINSGNGRVKVYTFSTGGTEITFNGTDNKFPKASLPKTLWVQGDVGSSASKDVELRWTCDSDFTKFDSVSFTVLWVDLSTRFSGNVSSDDSAKTYYNNALVPPKANPNDAPLGYNLYLQVFGPGRSMSSFGIGAELIGTAQPTNFVPSDYGFLGGELSLVQDVISGTTWFELPGDVRREFPIRNVPFRDFVDPRLADFDPQSGGSSGKIYQIDAPGQGIPPQIFAGMTALNAKTRWRANYRFWAEYASTRCSLKKDWYGRIAVKADGNRDNGTATAIAATSVTDAAKAWAANKWKDGVAVVAKAGVGSQFRRVVSNTGTALTVAPAWDPIPTTPGVVYAVFAVDTFSKDSGAPTGDNQGGEGTTKVSWDLS